MQELSGDRNLMGKTDQVWCSGAIGTVRQSKQMIPCGNGISTGGLWGLGS